MAYYFLLSIEPNLKILKNIIKYKHSYFKAFRKLLPISIFL